MKQALCTIRKLVFKRRHRVVLAFVASAMMFSVHVKHAAGTDAGISTGPGQMSAPGASLGAEVETRTKISTSCDAATGVEYDLYGIQSTGGLSADGQRTEYKPNGNSCPKTETTDAKPKPKPKPSEAAAGGVTPVGVLGIAAAAAAAAALANKNDSGGTTGTTGTTGTR